MIGHWILDEENRPVEVDLMTWARWWEVGDSNRRVDYTQINSEVFVSTVFLGFNHRFGGYHNDGPPILFETMVFGGAEDENQWRYSSWDDAKAGHDAVVSRLRRKQREHQHGGKINSGHV